ncbi:MAG TPA: tRNA dihydrouridine synthase DusB [Puia sp.]|nr:tRNA dihydrouridine synthase DusB [Puia sp.]
MNTTPLKIGNIVLPEFPLLLAPMEDVSDPPFRTVCKENGADLLYTEFISIESLVKGAIKSRKKLDIFQDERPVGIQVFGGDEDSMALAARIVEAANPDLLDINFGCPVKGIVGRGAGAGVLKDIDRMVRLTKAAVEATKLPVTVKTRLGWDDQTKNIEEVALRLQDTGIKALAIHGRTRCQLYKGEADWTLIGKVKNNPRIHIPIFGNGDINSPEKALEYKNRYGVDGIMVGRAAIGYPWIFREIRHYYTTGQRLAPPTIQERVAVCKRHLEKSVEWKGPLMGINEMRGRYAGYLKGLPGIKDFQKQLVQLRTREEVEEVLDAVQTRYEGFEMPTGPIELVNYHENCTV